MSKIKKQIRRLAAIMVTDMVGYAALMRRDETLGLELLELHQKRLRSFFSQFGGEEIKSTGDGFLVRFDSALGSARCALAIQTAALHQNQSSPAHRRVLTRIGLHVGEVVERDKDIFGDGVNVASRLESLAEPGGICLSQQAYDQICHKFPTQIIPAGTLELRKLGERMPLYKINLSPVNRPRTSDAAALSQRSIAVLPLVNISPDSRDEYLSDGITEELINVLGRVETIKVVSRTSTFAYKGKAEDVRRIGEQLNVRTVLEGSLLRLGNKLRITVRLVNVTDGFQLWAQTYERRLKDVFSIQQEVAHHVVDALHPKIMTGPSPPQLQSATQNPDAYKLYLKGRFHWNKRSSEGMVKALQCFRKAAHLDAGCALAYAGMADCYSLLAFYGGLPPHGAFFRAKVAAEKAVKLDNSLAETHTSLAYALMHDWDFDGSAREFETALRINPEHAPARLWRGIYFSVCGQHRRATAEVAKARELEPLSASVTAAAAMAHYFARQFDQATRLLKEALELEPDLVLAHEGLGHVFIQQHSWKNALSQLEAALAQTRFGGSMMAAIAYALARQGNVSRSRAMLKRIIRLEAKGETSAVSVAIAYAGLRDRDNALQWLRRACQQRSGKLVYLKANPIFDDMRSDKRVREILRRIGL
jgi:TolB-like protein/tetratricopeptide (TPR) repeat protein